MENIQKGEIKKPFGINLLTICIFLRFGFFQFISDFNAISNAEHATPILIAIILISRNVFVTGVAIWAFLGENWGRIALLAIVSLNVIWTLFNVITYVSFSNDQSNSMRIIFDLTNPLFWLGICWWYLNRKNVVEYYKSND